MLGEAALRSPYRKALGLASESPKRLSFDLGYSATGGSRALWGPLPSLEWLYDAFDEVRVRVRDGLGLGLGSNHTCATHSTRRARRPYPKP